MSNELVGLAQGINGNIVPLESATSRSNRVNNFLGFTYVYPDNEFDELDEYEDVYYDAEYREIIDDPSRLLAKGETGLAVVSSTEVSQYSIAKRVQQSQLAVYEQEILSGTVVSYQQTAIVREEKQFYIDGEYRELHDDNAVEIIKEEKVYLLDNSNINKYNVISASGEIWLKESGYCLTEQDKNGNETLCPLLSNPVPFPNNYICWTLVAEGVLCARVKVTCKAKYTKIDTILACLRQDTGYDCSRLFEASADFKGRLVLIGYLPTINFVLSYFNIEVRNMEHDGVYKVPTYYEILLKQNESLGVARFNPDHKEFTIVELKSAIAGIVSVETADIRDIPCEDRARVVSCACGNLDRVFIIDGACYVLSLNKNKSEQFNFQLYKALAMCYFGLGSRNAVWKALKQTAILYNIQLPAAAYICPIEYLQGIKYDCILSYLDNLFKIQRPVKDNAAIMRQIKSARSMSTLVDILLSLPNTKEPYPVSTIGLFAGTACDDDMLKQVAGSDDAELNRQLVQELTQILYVTEPKALSALLISHRSDLDMSQKQRAVKVLKKYLSEDESDFEEFDKKYKKVGKKVNA